MEDLSITLVQSSLFWENKERNLEMFRMKLDNLQQTGDIVVLPEMFTTGFSMNSDTLGEDMDGETVHWMKEIAKKKNCILVGSFIAKEGNEHFNRMVWMEPDGTHTTYDKRHLFRFAGENNYYSPGKERCIVEHKGWKIQLSICFDLRFPVFLRNQNDHDLLICNANWPEPRREAWKTLLKARAIENQVFVAGVNRVGEDGKEMTYSGDSALIHPKGFATSSIEPYEEQIETVELSAKELTDFREKFPVLKDRDDFNLRIQ